jgi:hypothetical protein
MRGVFPFAFGGLAAFVLSAPTLCAEALFVDESFRLGQQSPRDFSMDIAAADADGDGDIDLLFALEFAPNRLHLNDGSGSFAPAPDAALPANRYDSEDAAFLDANGDGALDLVVVSEDNRVDSYLLGDGDGRFIPAPDPLPRHDISNALAAFDADGDGDPDLVVGNAGPNVLYLNDGAGRFTPDERFPSGNGTTQDIALGDVNADGFVDIVVGNEGANQLLLGGPKGTFQDASDRLPGDLNETRDVEIGDVDADGDLDIHLSNVRLFTDLDPRNRLLLNDGTGRFVDAPAEALPADQAQSMDAAFVDLDGDGDLDLVVANLGDISGRTWTARVRAFLNDGTGRFTDATKEILPESAVANGMHIEVLDLDADGRSELAVASRGGPDLLLVPAE